MATGPVRLRDAVTDAGRSGIRPLPQVALGEIARHRPAEPRGPCPPKSPAPSRPPNGAAGSPASPASARCAAPPLRSSGSSVSPSVPAKQPARQDRRVRERLKPSGGSDEIHRIDGPGMGSTSPKWRCERVGPDCSSFDPVSVNENTSVGLRAGPISKEAQRARAALRAGPSFVVPRSAACGTVLSLAEVDGAAGSSAGLSRLPEGHVRGHQQRARVAPKWAPVRPVGRHRKGPSDRDPRHPAIEGANGLRRRTSH